MRTAALLVCAALSACGAARHAPTPESELPWIAPSDDPVVATVGGVPIRTGEVAAHARATGLLPKQALRDLVRQELLAQEARRRGLDHDPEVELARKQAMVRRFVVGEYGRDTAKPDAIPPDDARPVYARMRDYFDHDTVLKVWNVCTTPEQARSIYDEIRAHPPKSGDELKAIAQRHGAGADAVFAELENRALDYAWRKALFAAIKKKGDLLPPVHPADSKFPCTFVAWAEDVIPPRHDSFEQALPELRQRIHEDWRRKNFYAWAGRLEREHRIERHPEALEAHD